MGFGQNIGTPAKQLASYISNSSPLRTVHINPGTRASTADDVLMSEVTSRSSSRAASEIASEIVVHGDDEMDTDDPSHNTSAAESQSVDTPQAGASEPGPASAAFTRLDLNRQETFESPMSLATDQSELSSLPSSLSSSKATTPVDVDAVPEPLPLGAAVPPPSRQLPKRTFLVKPKSSIPKDLDDQEYATQCIGAAESCRLDPFSLHEEEYRLLRAHITHAQVTTYLNIRNSILRLWIEDTILPVSREQAVGCAGSRRWFDVANLCYDWLVRRGYINFGCVKIPDIKAEPVSDGPQLKQRTIVVIGAGMSGLGCARQLEGLSRQYTDHLQHLGELPPKIVVLEGRARVGGRVYSREFQAKPVKKIPGFLGERHTAEMGGMIITGFDRGNPINVLLRGQLGLDYRALRSETTIYDSNGLPVDSHRDYLVEMLYNDCLDRVSEYKHKTQPSKLIRGNQELIEQGRDSSSDGSKTISQAEEAAASLPNAVPVSQQNVTASVNLVPVSSDKATGRVHTEPGTPANQKASEKAKAMGWILRKDIAKDATIDLTEAVEHPDATLGSVLDEAIVQYRSLVDLTAQDHRLINWHIANLEYSNATTLHNLSLASWDIDAGNEWDGKHTMVVGGYQSVPRGLALCPTPLDLRTKSSVERITYHNSESSQRAVVECEDGSRVEADFVVSTIPLGVLKHPGSVTFDPPLPQWKQDVIRRMGFGVLNKVVLVYNEPFWDTSRNIFGVLRDAASRHSLNQGDYAASRGRFFQWFNVSDTTGLPCLVALMAGNAGFDTERESNNALVEEATSVLRSVFGRGVPDPVEVIVTRWESDKFARGSYSSSGPDMLPNDYNDMARSIGNLYFAGEHTIGTYPATVHGAYMSGLRAASEIFDEILGPLDVPTPLIAPKENAASAAKRKAEEQKNPVLARADDYESAAWNFIVSKIGLRPVAPPKVAPTAYMLYNKVVYDAAKKRCEEERSGKKKVSPNDVRVVTSKMWKSATPEIKRPYEEKAVKAKEEHTQSLIDFVDKSTKWDEDYVRLRSEYERDHPLPVVQGRLGSDGKSRRTSRSVRYNESDESDADR